MSCLPPATAAWRRSPPTARCPALGQRLRLRRRGAGHARYYSFTLAGESEVTITLERTSGDADTYLYLRQGAEAKSGALACAEGCENDDAGGTTRSRIQETLAAGSYTIEATTYSAGETGSFTLTVSGLETTAPTPLAADLVVDPPSVSDSIPDAGASFTLSATVRNRGDGASAPTTLRYYRSSDAVISSADTLEGSDSVSELNASGSGAESVSLTAPSAFWDILLRCLRGRGVR